MSDQKPRKIKLTQGKIALVDYEDFVILSRSKWYAVFNYNKFYAKSKDISMHRMIMKAKKGQQVDHINGDGLDNRKSNLRFCNHSQNRANSKPTSKTGLKGVVKVIRKDRKNKAVRYEAAIRFNKKRICLGWFNDPVSAAKAYDKAAIKYHGEFAYLNFPEVTNVR